jgi:hypothetical protein
MQEFFDSISFPFRSSEPQTGSLVFHKIDDYDRCVDSQGALGSSDRWTATHSRACSSLLNGGLSKFCVEETMKLFYYIVRCGLELGGKKRRQQRLA